MALQIKRCSLCNHPSRQALHLPSKLRRSLSLWRPQAPRLPSKPPPAPVAPSPPPPPPPAPVTVNKTDAPARTVPEPASVVQAAKPAPVAAPAAAPAGLAPKAASGASAGSSAAPAPAGKSVSSVPDDSNSFIGYGAVAGGIGSLLVAFFTAKDPDDTPAPPATTAITEPTPSNDTPPTPTPASSSEAKK
ncbi:MAG: hypothetical protein WDW36_006066 [Sanguina aurantia]